MTSEEIVNLFRRRCTGSQFPEMSENELLEAATLIESQAQRITTVEADLKKETHYAHCKDETATTFMNQVKRLQAQVESQSQTIAELQKDKERLGWLFSQLDDDVIKDKVMKVAMAFALRIDECNDFRTAMDVVITKGEKR